MATFEHYWNVTPYWYQLSLYLREPMATRELYWNTAGIWLLYPLLVAALAVFGYGVHRHLQLWRRGQPENRWPGWRTAIKDLLVFGLGQRRVLDDAGPGVAHALVLWAFLLFTFATAVVALQADFGLPLFRGWLYLFIKFSANLFGLLALVALGLAVWRRYVIRPRRLDSRPADAMGLLLLILLIATGFGVEGVRMAIVPDSWGGWSFAGKWLGSFLAGVFHPSALLVVHRYLWWFHVTLVFVFIGALPWLNLFHIILGPANIVMRNREPVGVPDKIDFEDESTETFGKSTLRDFSWKTLFNSDACIRCGRCEEHCPAHASGKHLNPKAAIQDMRTLMRGQAPHSAEPVLVAAGPAPPPPSLIGETIPEPDLWSCTTCRSCETSCPIFVEHVDKTIEMRRHLVLMESRFPPELNTAFRNLEVNANPWGITSLARGDHFKALEVPTLQEHPQTAVLYWPGCAGALDPRNQKVSAALVKLLRAAEVDFAILGQEERCCGDAARKLGNEYLFQKLATENIGVMTQYGVKKIVTQCPHCFHMLKNEYPQCGGEFEVIHHTEFLFDLIRQGKLKLRAKEGATAVYHDSCYLGRYNDVYAPPRQLLLSAGIALSEPPRRMERSFCCGAGGGRMWLDEKEGERINTLRTDELMGTGAGVIASACPFCLTMISDGIALREAGETFAAFDVAEILAQRI